jgi:hypothetical protein
MHHSELNQKDCRERSGTAKWELHVLAKLTYMTQGPWVLITRDD